MKIGNYTPDELRDANLFDLRLRGAAETSVTRLQDMYEFPQKIIEFFTEVRRIEENDLQKTSLSCNVPALEDRYFLVCRKPIGAGGMGKVYLFYDRNTNQYVVLKLVPLRYIREAARLEREKSILTALNKLNSPHLVKVVGLGIADFSFLYTTPAPYITEQDFQDTAAINANVNADDVPCYENQTFISAENVHIFLVMPYIQGETLGSYCLTYGEGYKHYSKDNNLLELLKIILQAVYQIAGVLEQIHKKGLVHRDIKPNNIIMKKGNIPVLIDFGIAQRQDIKGDQKAHCTITHGLGTPGYSDPCSLLYNVSMQSLHDKLKDIASNPEDMTKEYWHPIVHESEQLCKMYPLQTKRLAQQIRQYQRKLLFQRCVNPTQWLKKPSITAKQWHDLKILVEELQRCSHPYEDVFALGATLYWCLTGNTFTNATSLRGYLESIVAVEIKFTLSLFGVDNQENSPQKNNQLKETLTKVETALSNLLTKMLQHPLEKRCSLQEVQRELDRIIKMLPKK